MIGCPFFSSPCFAALQVFLLKLGSGVISVSFRIIQTILDFPVLVGGQSSFSAVCPTPRLWSAALNPHGVCSPHHGLCRCFSYVYWPSNRCSVAESAK